MSWPRGCRTRSPGADFDAMRLSPEGEVPLHRALTFRLGPGAAQLGRAMGHEVG